MIWLAPILYFLINVTDAFTDKNTNVNHTRGALLYATACSIIGLILLITQHATWYDILIFPLITRAAFFDPILNLMRGKNILYEGVKKPKGKRSWYDEFERKLDLSTFSLRIIYLAVYMSYLIFVYAN